MSRRAIQMLLRFRKSYVSPDTRLARINAKAVSRCAGGACSCDPTVSFRKMLRLAFSGLTSFQQQGIGVGNLMRPLPLPRRDRRRVDLCRIALFTIFTSQRPRFQLGAYLLSLMD